MMESNTYLLVYFQNILQKWQLFIMTSKNLAFSTTVCQNHFSGLSIFEKYIPIWYSNYTHKPTKHTTFSRIFELFLLKTECNLPQWEWRTARVQKATSVPKLVQTNGTIKAGICSRETNLSAVKNLTWSPLLWTAVVAKKWDGIKELLVFGIFEIKVWFLLKFFKPQRIACCLNNDEVNILKIS